jgi:hypothetical protein
MADGGRTDFYAPNSELDPVEPGAWYQNYDGEWLEICVNDFVDVNESISPDPLWGQSFQVESLLPGLLIVRMYDAGLDLYELIGLDPGLVYNCYKRRAVLSELPPGATVL